MSRLPAELPPVLYIAGPFTDDDEIHGISLNILNASKIALDCWKKGWAVICPHKNTAGFEHVSDVDPGVWYHGDLAFLVRCDAILLIPGWEESSGARTEQAFAIKHNIPMFDYTDSGIPDPKAIHREAK